MAAAAIGAGRTTGRRQTVSGITYCLRPAPFTSGAASGSFFTVQPIHLAQRVFLSDAGTNFLGPGGFSGTSW